MKFPELSAMVVAGADPVRMTVAPGPPAPLIVPEMLYVSTADVKSAVAPFPLRVSAWLGGEKTYPAWLGVTV